MSRLAEVLVRLVQLYPPAFRSRFGAEMALVLRDAACAARELPPPARLARSARIAIDVLAGAGCEWWNRVAEAARGNPRSPAGQANPAWARLRGASPQRTAEAGAPVFAPLPRLRRRHAGRALPARAPSMV